MIVLPEAEDRKIVCSFVLTKHWNVTDGQTIRRTDKQPVAITPTLGGLKLQWVTIFIFS